MKMEHWSATRFTSWGLCPVTFKEHYVDGVAREPSEQVLFGSAVHQAMEAHANGADAGRSFRQAWKAMQQEYLLRPSELTAVGLDLIERVTLAGWQGDAERVFTLD